VLPKNVSIHSINRFLFVASFSIPLIFCSCEKQDSPLDALLTEQKLRLVADAVLADATFRFIDQNSGEIYTNPEAAPLDARLHPESAYNDWRYWNGVLNLAMLKLGDLLDTEAYREFAPKNVAFAFDHYPYFEERWNGESKWEYPFGQRFILEELDDGGAMGASVIEVYRNDPQERYREYIDQVADHILTRQGRLTDGTLVRSFPRRWTLWADDLYMGVSFLARMGELSGDNRYFNDAAKQVVNFHKYLYSEEKGLMYHCWYSDTQQPGVAFWGRANGWALLAQVDLLDHLPAEFPQREELLGLLQKHILGIARYQSAEGLWHQLLDKEDSYLETSCSAIFSYVLARAVNQGYLKPSYAAIAGHGWQGVMTRIHSDGQIEGVCTGTGVGDDLEFYYNRPAPLNDVHGIGFILLAGAEVMQLAQ